MSFIQTMPLSIIQRSLDASALRQKVLSNNIANVDTPNFKRSDVSFDSVLQSYLSGAVDPLPGKLTNSRHIPIGAADFAQLQPQVVTDNSTVVTNNGNNVNIDSEMSQVAENQLRYNTLVQGLSIKFAELNTAVNGGGTI
ncbi:MAG: flagellar basal-body rod protein FlgB [Bacilli bacterium]|nr:flagellar basal-body rod protein FlgB [Bacilli bacterium]